MAKAADLFERMPALFNAEKAGDFSTVVQFDLSGEDGGQWVVTIDDGQCAVKDGTTENPSATIRMKASDYVDMIMGELDPMSAFIQQKVKVEGDLSVVMKIQGLFDTD